MVECSPRHHRPQTGENFSKDSAGFNVLHPPPPACSYSYFGQSPDTGLEPLPLSFAEKRERRGDNDWGKKGQ